MSDFSGGAPLWARFVNSGDPSAEARPERNNAARAWIVPKGSERLSPPPGAPADCPLPFDWERRNYAALDVETTGLDAYRDRVIEAGVVLFSFDSEGAIVEEEAWGSLINPGIPIPASATAIHGITDLDISAAPFFRDVIVSLDSVLKGRVLVAHNAAFDSEFLNSEYSRLGLASPFSEIADSLALLRLAVPTLFSYNLGKAAFVLGIEAGTSHRALDDARTCMQIFAQSARKLAGSCP